MAAVRCRDRSLSCGAWIAPCRRALPSESARAGRSSHGPRRMARSSTQEQIAQPGAASPCCAGATTAPTAAYGCFAAVNIGSQVSGQGREESLAPLHESRLPVSSVPTAVAQSISTEQGGAPRWLRLRRACDQTSDSGNKRGSDSGSKGAPNEQPTLSPQSRGWAGRCGQSASGAGRDSALGRRVYSRASITRPSNVSERRERSERSELFDATQGRSSGGQSVPPTAACARTGQPSLGFAATDAGRNTPLAGTSRRWGAGAPTLTLHLWSPSP